MFSSAVMHSRSPGQEGHQLSSWFQQRRQERKARRYHLLVLIHCLEGIRRLCSGAGIPDRPAILWMRNQSCSKFLFSGLKAVKIGFFCTVIMSKICWIQDRFFVFFFLLGNLLAFRTGSGKVELYYSEHGHRNVSDLDTFDFDSSVSFCQCQNRGHCLPWPLHKKTGYDQIQLITHKCLVSQISEGM